jgi:hypothetical protein
LKIKRRAPPTSLIYSDQSGLAEAFQKTGFSCVPRTDLFDAPAKVIAGPGTLGKGAKIGQQHHRPVVRVGLLGSHERLDLGPWRPSSRRQGIKSFLASDRRLAFALCPLCCLELCDAPRALEDIVSIC